MSNEDKCKGCSLSSTNETVSDYKCPDTVCPDDSGHDGQCQCGVIVPCEEAECTAPPGHESICKECLEKEKKRPIAGYGSSHIEGRDCD